MNDFKLDLRVFLAEAVSTNEKARKTLEGIYKKHKYKAYELAHNHEYYDHPMLIDGDIHKEVAAKRMLGLILLHEQDEIPSSDIDKIINSGWEGLSRYVAKKQKVSLEDIVLRFCNKDSLDDEINGVVTVALILALGGGVDVDKDKYYQFATNVLYERFMHYQGVTRVSYSDMDETTKDKARSIIKRCEEEYGKISNIQDLYLIEDETMKRFVDSISVVFDTENLMFTSVTNSQDIEGWILEEMAAIYYLWYRNQDRFEAMKFIIVALHMKYMAMAYKDVKKYHFQHNQETMYYEMDKLVREKEFAIKEWDSLAKENKALKSTIERLRTEYKDSIELDNISKEKEIVALKDTISELKQDNEEIEKLRFLLFSDEEPIEETEFVDLSKYRCIVFGGHPNWVSRAKELLPDTFTFYDGFQDFDDSVIKSVDAVFFKFEQMSHHVYYKAIAAVKRNGVKFGYIKSSSMEFLMPDLNKVLSE